MDDARHIAMETRRLSGGETTHKSDQVVAEAPLQIAINGTPFSITMRTPGDDEALAIGLLFSEGIIQYEPGACTLNRTSENEINIEIPEIYLCTSLREKRTIASSASCGICGKTEFEALKGDPLSTESLAVTTHDVRAMYRDMESAQPTFAATGGCHAAALFMTDGSLLCCHEDVGRHNAVDKCIGRLLMESRLTDAHLLLVSGRVSYEIVAKAYRAGTHFLCAVSAPSSLAVKTAKRLGITLSGFCREDRMTVYTHPDRIQHG